MIPLRNTSKKMRLTSRECYGTLDEAQGYFFKIYKINPNAGVTIKILLTGLKAESKLSFLKELQERQQRFLERDPNAPAITGIPTRFH